MVIWLYGSTVLWFYGSMVLWCHFNNRITKFLSFHICFGEFYQPYYPNNISSPLRLQRRACLFKILEQVVTSSINGLCQTPLDDTETNIYISFF